MSDDLRSLMETGTMALTLAVLVLVGAVLYGTYAKFQTPAPQPAATAPAG